MMDSYRDASGSQGDLPPSSQLDQINNTAVNAKTSFTCESRGHGGGEPSSQSFRTILQTIIHSVIISQQGNPTGHRGWGDEMHTKMWRHEFPSPNIYCHREPNWTGTGRQRDPPVMTGFGKNGTECRITLWIKILHFFCSSHCKRYSTLVTVVYAFTLMYVVTGELGEQHSCQWRRLECSGAWARWSM